MKKLIVANWKMNPKTIDEARKLVSSWEHRVSTVSGHVDVVVCAPFVYLPALSHYTQGVLIGAQNASWEELGALTGEVSALMLRQWNVKYVILGHSERRLYLGETDSMVNAKILACLKQKITPIVCLGEELTEQFHAVTKRLDVRQLEKIVYVYEPASAISTMKNSKPVSGEDSAKKIDQIRELLKHKIGRMPYNVRILYGGTVNKLNVHEYAKFPNIDGALVGAASLESENFWEIVKEFNRESIHRG